ncbi:HU family DNA-binding protein [Cytobacillus gottheilii]|uniref:HU family DNA-binding protein n=1 Tax=Cytobacillus gottheilii TaxID=859144 RepID=UPI0009BC6AA1|nr:HU family DNA-binding protein [Cytobacillus gottheilii]
MNKTEFKKFAAEKLEVSQKEAEQRLQEVFQLIEDALVEHGEVPLADLGKLVVVERAERNGVNPQTKEKIVIPAKKTPAFKPSKHLKELVL